MSNGEQGKTGSGSSVFSYTMKRAIFASFLFLALVAFVSVDAAGHRFNLNLPVNQLFDEWLVVYPQHFANPAARTKCFTIFKENVVERSRR